MSLFDNSNNFDDYNLDTHIDTEAYNLSTTNLNSNDKDFNELKRVHNKTLELEKDRRGIFDCHFDIIYYNFSLNHVLFIFKRLTIQIRRISK